MLAIATPAAAITYGELDNGEHPYVGFLIFFDPSTPGWFSCSGTLLDADTVLTAGHCVADVGTDGGTATSAGANDIWFTVDPDDTLAGWPARTDEISEADLYALRSAWLNDPAHGFVRGIAIPHPEYENFAAFPMNFDVGVVELPMDSFPMQTYGQLADIGSVEILAGSTGRDRNIALVETVGYGTQSVQPHPQSDDTRYKSTSRIVQINGNASTAGNLHTLNNPSSIGGRGGSCFGDSGGPVFINDTNLILAVVSFGFSGTCHGADYSWRVDTVDSQAFITPFVDG